MIGQSPSTLAQRRRAHLDSMGLNSAATTTGVSRGERAATADVRRARLAAARGVAAAVPPPPPDDGDDECEPVVPGASALSATARLAERAALARRAAIVVLEVRRRRGRGRRPSRSTRRRSCGSRRSTSRRRASRRARARAPRTLATPAPAPAPAAPDPSTLPLPPPPGDARSVTEVPFASGARAPAVARARSARPRRARELGGEPAAGLGPVRRHGDDRRRRRRGRRGRRRLGARARRGGRGRVDARAARAARGSARWLLELRGVALGGAAQLVGLGGGGPEPLPALPPRPLALQPAHRRLRRAVAPKGLAVLGSAATASGRAGLRHLTLVALDLSHNRRARSR